MDKSKLLEGLNDRQREAVEYTDGPLLILAGAGSGKTRILTHRISYLIENGVMPWNILAITFTNKAAAEMRERADALLDAGDAGSVFISTFHSMCVRILRRDIEQLGYSRDFTIYDADDQRTLVRQCIKKLNLDTKMFRERGIASTISAQKNGMISAAEYEEMAADFYDRKVAAVYREYENELKANNALDFDDLLLKTVELFENHPDVLERWQDRFRYIMVDEYQDTNNVQFRIVSLLADKYNNLCVVGDDDQSIYRFRGANIRNILDFEDKYPRAKVIKLEQNYRSTTRILNAANEVIKNNRGRKPKKLWTNNGEGELPVYTEFSTAAGEADYVARHVLESQRAGLGLKHQAVLYRTNAQSRLFEEKCVQRNIPYVIVGGVNFYQRKEIKDILSYLHIIANGSDDLACTRVINVPKRGIGQTSVDRAAAFAAENELPFYEALGRASEIPGAGAAAVKKMKTFWQMIEGFKSRLAGGTLSLKQLIEAVRDETGYADELGKEDPVSAKTRLENIEELISKAVSFEESYKAAPDTGTDASGGTEADAAEPDGKALLSAFMEDVSLVADIDRADTDSDVLKLMTLHAAKGLEFDTVYMCGMEEGLFPSSASINSNDPEGEIEEERRLCYVGITRAKKRLYLSSSRERMVNGDVRSMRPSRFIEELTDGVCDKHFLASRRNTESFAGFGGYEGRLEYGYRNESGGYGAAGQRYHGDRADGQYGSAGTGYSEERAYSAYNSYNISSNPYGLGTGHFGSLDTTPAGRRGRAKSLSGIPGLKRGFGELVSGGPAAGAGTAGAGGNIKQKPDYDVGDRVAHVKFGTGTVLSITDEKKDYKVQVEFDQPEYGTKNMYAGFAKLKKLC